MRIAGNAAKWSILVLVTLWSSAWAHDFSVAAAWYGHDLVFAFDAVHASLAGVVMALCLACVAMPSKYRKSCVYAAWFLECALTWRSGAGVMGIQSDVVWAMSVIPAAVSWAVACGLYVAIRCAAGLPTTIAVGYFVATTVSRT